MVPAHEEHNKSPTRLTIPRNRILLAENKHTHESRQREEKTDSTKAKANCKMGDKQK
jgi:hypothetical protein